MNKYEKVAYCGIYCGDCKNFKQNYNCQGCRFEPNMVNDCPTRACAISKKLTHCGECEDFPCKLLKDFYEDGNPMHESAQINIQKINEQGIENWIKEKK